MENIRNIELVPKYKNLISSISSSLIFLSLLFLILLNQSCKKECNKIQQNEHLSNKFVGLCYGPYRVNEDPDFGVNPTINELSEDISLIEKLTISIRTYGVTDGLEQIPLLCQENGIDCFPGAWISKLECENEKQINSLITIANQNLSHVKGLIVGNEVLLRKDVSVEQLLDFILRVKDSTNLPVATAETFSDWLIYPELANAVDILFVHIYPYWAGKSINDAPDYILESWNEVKKRYPGKTMVIGETGWPSEGRTIGNAIPGEENQKKYFSDFLTLAKNQKIDYFYFEIFDEDWKNKFEGETGSHWGMYYSDGSIKEHLINLIPTEANNGFARSARVVIPTIATLPTYIYKDGCSPENKFHASGWMGELADLAGGDSTNFNPFEIIDESCADNPYSAETCIRISYTPSSEDKWGGIYWQFPINNWGFYPGYDFSNSINENDTITLSFWARGKNGGEKANFRTGGINNPNLSYRDSYGPVETGYITLTSEWGKFSLDLTGREFNMVIGVFCWVSSFEQNPNEATIYLDEILIEVTNSKAFK